MESISYYGYSKLSGVEKLQEEYNFLKEYIKDTYFFKSLETIANVKTRMETIKKEFGLMEISEIPWDNTREFKQ